MRRTLLLLPLLIPLSALAPGTAPSYCDGYGYVAHEAPLLRFDPRTGATTAVRDLPAHVNAMAVHDGHLFALARPGARPVRLSPDGQTAELGPIVGAPAGDFNGAYVAAAHQGSWLLLHEDRLFRVDLETLTVTGKAALAEPIRIGDWAADEQGRLLSLSTAGDRASLIGVDADSGAVEVLAYPAGLPADSVFGAVWLLGDHLYAWHNAQRAIYRVDLSRPDSAQLLASGLPAGSVDGASCDAPPETPTPVPSQSPTPGGIAAPVPIPPGGTVPPPAGVTLTTPPAPRASPARTPAVASSRAPRQPGPAPSQETLPRSKTELWWVPTESIESSTTRRFVAAGAGALALLTLLTLRRRGR